MIKHEYRSFVIKNGSEASTAVYQEAFGYRLVTCSYTLSGVKMIFVRDITSPCYPLWCREEKLHYHLLNDVKEIQKEINYVHRKAAFPSSAALVFWLLMFASLGLVVWMTFVMNGKANPVDGSGYYLALGVLVFVTALTLYLVLVISHRQKWHTARRELEKDQKVLVGIDRRFMEDLAKSNKVPLVPFETIKAIEEKDKLGSYSK
jgi:uncharacterized membrane protein (DUF485 family)